MKTIRFDDGELAELEKKAGARRLKVEPYIRHLVSRDRPPPAPVS